MTDEDRADPAGRSKGIQAAMTARLAFRQFGLLFLAGTALLLSAMLIDYYGVTFFYLWPRAPVIQYKGIGVHSILLLIYGYPLLMGVLFALGPSERTFRFFFYSMLAAVLAVNYDHSIVDWFFSLFRLTLRPHNPVGPLKVATSGLLLLVLIAMHYNVLSDDFARRMIRRGIPIDEVAHLRPAMFKVLVPTVMTAIGVAFALALVGEFSSFIFGQAPQLPGKVQLWVLAGLVIPIAFLLRSILRELAARRVQRPPTGPNR